MNCNKLLRTIKANLIIRAVSFPYMNIKKQNDYKKYKASEYPRKIRELKDIYKGKRCFIVGNGSSLKSTDLDKIKGEISFACNRIYEIFDKTDWRPTFYIAEDEDAYEEIVPKVIRFRLPNYIFSPNAKKYLSDDTVNVYYAYFSNLKYVINRYNDKSSHISLDISDHISDGYTVTFSAIQTAIYMGITDIYLIGVDFNYSAHTDKWGRLVMDENVVTYFDGKEHFGSYLNYYSTLNAYNAAADYAKKKGVRIYNATRGGKLEVFPRVSFDGLF